MDNQFLGCLPCTASTASYLKDAIFLMIQWRKACLIFQAKMISLQLEWPIPFHSMVIASFWGQKYINSWDLTSEAVLRSSEATFQNVLKWFWLHFHTILISNGQEKASMSSVQAWPQRLIWRLLRLGSVNGWILRLMHKFHH